MPVSPVPDAFVPAFAKLHEVSEDGFSALVRATEVLHSPSGISDFVALASKSAGIDHKIAATLLDALMSLIAHADEHGLDLGQLIDGISTAEVLGLDHPERQLLASRIRALVSHGPMHVLYKSVKLALQHERLFLDCGITTDVRPIFGDEITDGLAAAVLTHSLRIDFLRAGTRDCFHVALDQEDLLMMKETTDRALAKASSLRDTLESAGISNLTAQE